MIYSFDIFDTCLVRKCGAAVNVFDLLARRAFTQPVSQSFYASFVVERKRAEHASYHASQTLHDIYAEFTLDLPYLRSKDELLSLEQECEREMLVPVTLMREKVSMLRNEGHQIVFISDMYLSSNFLREVLTNTGFYAASDQLFVSCEMNATKSSGELYKIVKDKLERSSFADWHHYGDNKHSDIAVPKKLGIKAHCVHHDYTPYQVTMAKIASTDYQWGGIIAGLGRALSLQSKANAHHDIVLDLIAPLFTTFVYRVMKDAASKGLKRLYFCARDAYPLYRIACCLRNLFPTIGIEYLYISRTALYEGVVADKIGYYQQIGLASPKPESAIVDMRSSGKTLVVLNQLLEQNDFATVHGYFFELCDAKDSSRDIPYSYWSDLDDRYVGTINSPLHFLSSNWYMYELFFPLNTQKRTSGYECVNGEFRPIFDGVDKKEYRLAKLDVYVAWRNETMDLYAQWFVELGLHQYADNIFEQYVLPQLVNFFRFPDKHYLPALEEFYGEKTNGKFVPYVQKNLFKLPMNVLKKRTMWKRGTIQYNLPACLNKLLFAKR